MGCASARARELVRGCNEPGRRLAHRTSLMRRRMRRTRKARSLEVVGADSPQPLGENMTTMSVAEAATETVSMVNQPKR